MVTDDPKGEFPRSCDLHFDVQIRFGYSALKCPLCETIAALEMAMSELKGSQSDVEHLEREIARTDEKIGTKAEVKS